MRATIHGINNNITFNSLKKIRTNPFIKPSCHPSPIFTHRRHAARPKKHAVATAKSN